MVSLVRKSKPDATLLTGVTSGTIVNILRTGKPVIAKLGSGWAVYTGYNAATKVFTNVGIGGELRTTTLNATTKRDLIY